MIPAPLVVFGEDWGGHPSSTQHLVSRLVADRDVLWVNSIGMRRPRLDRHDILRVGRKLAAAWARPAPNALAAVGDAPRPTVATARAVSWPGSPLVEALNRRLVPASLRGHLERLPGGRPIVWSSLPTAAPVIDRLGARAVVYYAGDDFSALSGVDHGPVARLERSLPGARTRVLPHGCDIALFDAPVLRARDLPTDRPVAGFYGSLSDWIDVELLAATATLLPDWHFFLIGAIRCDVGPLARLANVTLAGPRPHGELPAYCRHWTASLLPFRDNAQIAACNPLKLREYLAAGRPVISTVAFAALEPYREKIRLATKPSDLGAALREALAEPDGLCAERRAAVAGESWEARSATVSGWLSELG